MRAGVVWFVDAADQAIRQRDTTGAPRGGETPPPACATPTCGTTVGRLIAVVETPRGGPSRATIEAITLEGERGDRGHDFYAGPRLSLTARVSSGWPGTTRTCPGTRPNCGRPNWPRRHRRPVCGRRGRLAVRAAVRPAGRSIVCDANDWWNIHRETATGFEALTRERAEFGQPQWVFGQSTCAFADDGTLYALATRDGIWQLGRVDTVSGAFTPLPTAADFFEHLHVLGERPVAVAANAAMPKQILAFAADGTAEVLRAGDGLPEAAVLPGQGMTWPTADGDVAHGLFYPPASADSVGPADERPPLILKCHGGPTGATSTALDARIQYWTSRGYALLDVNYRGSTGYGRAYRGKLGGAWGIADVEDCVHGARYLAERDAIDADRVLISGSSAGGYTVLCVLTFTDIAAAGASYYASAI